jgi:CheY-like chemotaxis protein
MNAGSGNMVANRREPNEVQVLIVDDDDELRSVIRLALRRHGFSVTEARNGVEALGLFVPGRFDLVLTDCEMPRMTGAALIERIRLQAPDQRIGLISGHVQNCVHVMDKVNFNLSKPFCLDELSREVRRVLGLDDV